MTHSTAIVPLRDSTVHSPPASPWSTQEAIVSFYADATQDYRFWSPDNLNMHFGLGTWRHLFDREAMLEAMNTKVLDALLVPDQDGTHVIDLGCGTGATIRCGAGRTTATRFTGVTLSPEQARRGWEMNARHPGANRMQVIRSDYGATALPAASYDGASAIESACHAPGSDKARLIAEAARLLKPGAKLVVADAFRTDHGRPLHGVTGAAYRALCRSWALPGLAEIHDFSAALTRLGFEDIRIEDISWQVALSVLHVPLVCLAYAVACLRVGDRPAAGRRANLIASILAPVLGLARWRFSYCVVTATRSR